MKAFQDGFNVTAVLCITLILIMLIMSLLPFFIFKSDNALTGESQTRANGYQSIFGIVCKKSSDSTNKSGMDYAISLYDNEDTRGAMTTLGIAGLIALASAIVLLVLQALSIFGRMGLASAMKAVGVLLIIASLLALVMGFVVAANATSLNLGGLASAGTMLGAGLWLFSIFGIIAGALAFSKPCIKRHSM